MAHFNPFRPSYAADPYPELARLRAQEPVHRGADVRDWIITGYEPAMRALQDDEYFSSDPAVERGRLGEETQARRGAVPLGRTPILGQADAPEHTRLRAVVNRALTPRMIEGLRPRVAAFVDAVLRENPAGFEVMKQLAEPLPVIVALDVIGVPPADHMRVRQWSGAIMEPIAGAPPEPARLQRSAAAAREFGAYLRALGGAAGAVREDTMLATLLASLGEGEITLDDAIMMVIHVSFAGNGPTAMMIGNGVLALAAHPGALAALREDRSLAERATEEILRYDSPTHHVIRFVRRDTMLGARRVRTGESVHVVIGAANRDPARFPDPDRFAIDREEAHHHLSFSRGIHFCLGAPVARLIGQEVFARIASSFEALTIPEGGFERGGTFLLRGAKSLRVVPRESSAEGE